MNNKITRRQFFRLGVLDLTESLLDSVLQNPETSAKNAIRPPGAITNEQEFQDTCSRCRDCSNACPYDVIQHLGPASGLDEGTPYLIPNEHPCHWCPTMDCIQACPTGALSYNDYTKELLQSKPQENKPRSGINPIAKANLNLNLCLTSQGVLCDDCVTSCPSSIKAIKLVGKSPQLDSALCVGCGLCSYHCPATPNAIEITSLH